MKLDPISHFVWQKYTNGCQHYHYKGEKIRQAFYFFHFKLIRFAKVRSTGLIAEAQTIH